MASAMKDGSFDSISCVGTNTCNCTAKLHDQPAMDTGTYSVANTTLTTVSSGDGSVEADPFCAKGGQLQIAFSDSGASSSTASSTTYLTAKKK